MHHLPVFALVLTLSTGWWGEVLQATAAALGLAEPTTAEETDDSACSMDPWGCPPSPSTDSGSEWDPWGKP